MLMTITAALAFTAVVLHAIRSGHVYPDAARWRGLTRLGYSSLLVAVAGGLVARARNGDPFEWFHWPILAAFTLIVISQTALISSEIGALHRLGHGLRGKRPCTNPDCVEARAFIAAHHRDT